MEDANKTNVGQGLKGIVTHNPEDTAKGFMSGQPSPTDKMIAQSAELQQSDPEGIISKIKNNVLRIIKTPTTLVRGTLDTAHGATKWATLQVNKGVQQIRNLVFIALAVPAKAWEVTSNAPKWAIKKITDTTHAAVDKVIGAIPTNSPQQAQTAA